jgi:hypothetical protein
VLDAYRGGLDTDMLAGIEAEKAKLKKLRSGSRALAAGETLVFPDDASSAAAMV